MRRTTAGLLLTALVVLFAACSDPKSVKVTAETKDDLLKSVKDQKGLTVDETRLLLAYQIRQGAARAFGGTAEDPVGKTLGELIEEQRKFEADADSKQKEADRLAAEAKAKSSTP